MPEELSALLRQQLLALRDRVDAHEFAMLALLGGLKRIEEGKDPALRTTLEQVRDIVTKNADEARKKEIMSVFSTMLEFYDTKETP